MELGHVAQCDGDPLRHLLARGVARVRPGTGGGGTGRDHERQERQGAVEEADQRPGHEEVAGTGRVVAGGAVDQDDGVDQQEHGGEEVHHDDVGVELGVDDDAAEDGLGQHAAHQPSAQPHQVAPARGAEDRAEEGRGHPHGQDDGDQAVPELHQAVELQRGGQVPDRALGPVGAPQARAGQADPGPGQHDEGGQDQGHDVEPVAQRGRDGGGTAPRHSGASVPAPVAWSRACPRRRLHGHVHRGARPSGPASQVVAVDRRGLHRPDQATDH